LADGHVESLGSLYEAHAPACLGYARTLCGPGLESAAEDLVHDVFVRMLRSGSPPAEPGARSYLLMAIRNGAANLRRDAAREQLRLRQHAGPPPVFGRPADHQTMDFTPGEVTAWLNRLPPEQRETVYLRIWGGMTFAQVAALTSVPLRTAASRFRYGLSKLRELMECRHDD
jgi:RNA polymerase sigma factor (sigma-70 family)